MELWPGKDAPLDTAIDETGLAGLVLATRLIGADPSLVLHGGGNSSLKSVRTDVTGAEIEVLVMKSSGSSMAEASESSFTVLRLDRLRELLPPTVLTDDQFANEVRCARLDADAPDPSLETLVHTALPHACVLHSHADAILAITDTPGGEARIAAALGPEVLVVDYAMPGVDLAAAMQRAWGEAGSETTVGAVVPRHGLFTFGATGREAYERHAALIGAAEEYLTDRLTPTTPPSSSSPSSSSSPNARFRSPQTDTHGDPSSLVSPSLSPSAADGQDRNLAFGGTGDRNLAFGGKGEGGPAVDLGRLARLRRRISDAAGRDMLLRLHDDDAVAAFVTNPALLDAACRGPITPDHATRTKGRPLIGENVEEYAAAYRTYVADNAARRERVLVELDPAPRVVLDPEIGLAVAGPDAAALTVNGDIARHALAVIAQAESLGGYEPVDEGHVFDLEYWSLQQAKMLRGTEPKALDGQVAIVTGAASGIGRACAQALLGAGCAVVGWDISANVPTTFDTPAWLGVRVDVSNEEQVLAGLRAALEHFGGVDILLVAAGIFPTSKPLGEMELSEWQRTMRINVDSVVTLYGNAWPLLEQSRQGGRVVVIASKNVIAPGAGAAAYSASKAALTQLSRVAALEWAPKGIRVNLMHPDAVFDTGLWTPELLAARAEHYGLTVDAYKRRNLLKTEVTSAACGALALAMVTEPFRATTGAQVAIDGGSDRTL